LGEPLDVVLLDLLKILFFTLPNGKLPLASKRYTYRRTLFSPSI